MSKGQLYQSESKSFTDEQTGARLRQVTAHPSTHHHPHFYVPCFDHAMERLFFVSHRTGRPEILVELQDGGKLLQLTEHDGIDEWSVHPSRDGVLVYFTARGCAWRLETETLEEERLADLAIAAGAGRGVPVEVAGPTSLSADDRWWAIPVRCVNVTRLLVLDTVRVGSRVLLERDALSRPQFHPDDPDLLCYSGGYRDPLWVIQRDGTGNRLVYRRDAAKKEWIVHETWRPGGREILAVNWPRGVIGVDADSDAVRQVCSFNAWHAAVDRRGVRACADTCFPDIGLQLFDPLDGVGAPKTLCLPKASAPDPRWKTDHCPYDDGPTHVADAPQTHPHPCFSPDGRRVVFASDRTAHSQVYEVELLT